MVDKEPMSTNRGDGEAFAWISGHLNYKGDDCLIWPFSIIQSGYGQLGYMGEIWRANRLMCTLVHGEPPTPFHEAAHSCHNRACVNPNHLSWLTKSENQIARRENGTANDAYWGSGGKLTEAQRTEIKALKNEMTTIAIGKLYDITPQYVTYLHKLNPNRILKLRAWQSEEIQYLKGNYRSTADIKPIAKHLGRNENSIRSKVAKLRTKSP